MHRKNPTNILTTNIKYGGKIQHEGENEENEHEPKKATRKMKKVEPGTLKLKDGLKRGKP